jgi:hypothetical protein
MSQFLTYLSDARGHKAEFICARSHSCSLSLDIGMPMGLTYIGMPGPGGPLDSTFGPMSPLAAYGIEKHIYRILYSNFRFLNSKITLKCD